MSSQNERVMFVTVGSTRFDDLVEKVLTEEMGKELANAGFGRLVVQSGNSQVNFDDSYKVDDNTWILSRYNLRVEVWKFQPDLREAFSQADLVVCHAGSGTLIEALRLQKRVIAIPNETLLHNHQVELAEALESSGYLVASTVRNLTEVIELATKKSFIPFPEYDGSKLQGILDQEMGFL